MLGLLMVFNTTRRYIPFAKIVQVIAMHKFGEYDFLNNGALRDDGDV
jgi:hypothetical protein